MVGFIIEAPTYTLLLFERRRFVATLDTPTSGKATRFAHTASKYNTRLAGHLSYYLVHLLAHFYLNRTATYGSITIDLFVCYTCMIKLSLQKRRIVPMWL